MSPERTRGRARMERWAKFYAVGAMGICVQLLAVDWLAGVLEMNSWCATALAVEAAVLHNFFWHEHFTWRDRATRTPRALLRRLLGFNATTGALSMAGNLSVIALLTGELHLSLCAANLLAIAACSLGTFAASDMLIFRAGKSSTPKTPS